MMEIEFRLISVIGKIVGYEKWYTGSLDSKNFWTVYPCWLYSKDGKYWNPTPIVHRHKDRYTGLKDKHKKMIFEGDIIEAENIYPLEVYWMGIAWGFRFMDGKNLEEEIITFEEDTECDKNGNFKYLEIIGNIHEGEINDKG